MEMEITLPEEIAVMTLPELTLFPQALLPLHIFEPRYRSMLSDVLDTHRMFAVAKLVPGADPSDQEPLCKIATVGMIRACQQANDGTSNLLIQGLVRVRVEAVLREEPYRLIKVRPLASEAGGDANENETLRRQLDALLETKLKLSGKPVAPLRSFLHEIDDPEMFVDLAAFNLCEDHQLKQKLLETLNLNRRLRLFSERLRRDIAELRLARDLQGNLSEDDIGDN